LDFYAGSVSVSGSSRIRRTANLTVRGGSALYDLVSTPGAIFKVMHGIRFTAVGVETIPVITGELSGAAQSLGDGTIGLDIADFWQVIDGTDFTVDYQPATTTGRVAEITARITAAVPTATVSNLSTDTGTVGTTRRGRPARTSSRSSRPTVAWKCSSPPTGTRSSGTRRRSPVPPSGRSNPARAAR
jgi:hypothetical protein